MFSKFLNFLRIYKNHGFTKLVVELKLWGPEFYKNYIYRRYCKGFLSADLSAIENDTIKQLYSDFDNQGFCEYSINDELLQDIYVNEKLEQQHDDFGRIKTVLPNFDEQKLTALIGVNSMQLLKLIYGRDFWIRENAFIMEHKPESANGHIQAQWHVDGYNQVTLQILLEDSDINSTCTEMIVGSSKKRWGFDRKSLHFR